MTTPAAQPRRPIPTRTVSYGYNEANDLTSLTYKQGTTTVGDLTYTYDPAGRRTKIGGPFSRATVPPALTTTNYNANSQQLTFGTKLHMNVTKKEH